MSTATTRSAEFVAQFEAVNADLIATVEGCTDEQWRQQCEDEGRSAGVIAYHVAATNEAFAQMLGALASGQIYSPKSSMAEIHAHNAQQARDNANVGKAEVLEGLRQHGAAIVQTLRSLGDDQLDKVAGIFGGNELTIGQVIEYVVVGHTREHRDSIRAGINA
jgi:hypothetical protein